MARWQGIDTIPLDREVEVMSAREKKALARVRLLNGRPWVKPADRYGPRRVMCVRMDDKKGGDLWARCWRDLPRGPKRRYGRPDAIEARAMELARVRAQSSQPAEEVWEGLSEASKEVCRRDAKRYIEAFGRG